MPSLAAEPLSTEPIVLSQVDLNLGRLITVSEPGKTTPRPSRTTHPINSTSTKDHQRMTSIPNFLASSTQPRPSTFLRLLDCHPARRARLLSASRVAICAMAPLLARDLSSPRGRHPGASIVNSRSLIIGAMLISRSWGPILATGLGWPTGADLRLTIRAAGKAAVERDRPRSSSQHCSWRSCRSAR